MDEKYIVRRYTHPTYPGALSGLSGFLKNNNYKDPKEVERVLSTLDAYVSHKPARKKFPRRPMICPKIDYVWSIDLADMQQFKTRNKNHAYILVAVDCLSKYIFTAALKKKTGEGTSKALETIFKTHKRRPESIFVDRGTEFRNHFMKKLLKENKVKIYHSYSHLKSFQAERAIRTLKAKLFRYMTQNKNSDWLSGLQDITKSINNSYNRAIGMPSSSVKKSNVSEVWHKLYHSVVTTKKVTPKYKLGDKVRVSVKKLAVGSKSYTKSFGPEVFTVSEIFEYHPIPVYKLEDENGAQLEGGFNQFELAKTE